MKTLTLIAALLVSPAALADDTYKHKSSDTADTRKPAKLAKLTAKELQVAAHYHELNQMEVDLGQAALRISDHQGIRSYAEMLIKDHGDGDKKLVALVKARGQTIPAEKPVTGVMRQMKADDKAKAAKLKRMSGAEFDTAFIQAMIDGHEKELSLVDTFAASVSDPELRDEVRAKKQTLQHHADEARALRSDEPVATR
jgi:putative membrane protein